jgi:hypothetical protein
VYCIYLVENGDSLWAVMNAVMNIWVPQNDCFSRLAEESFHRRTPWRFLFNSLYFVDRASRYNSC